MLLSSAYQPGIVVAAYAAFALLFFCMAIVAVVVSRD